MDSSTSSSSAADQARIRKERREAKLKQNAGARLNRITSLGGGSPKDPSPQSSSFHADPEEVQISQHHYNSATSGTPGQLPPRSDQIDENALRQMMLGMDPTALNWPPDQSPRAGIPGLGGSPGSEGMRGLGGHEDLMMKILQQMMGTMGSDGAAGGMSGFPGLSPISSTTASVSNPYEIFWRIIHAIFALSLGLYVAFATTFTGTKIEREKSAFLPRVDEGTQEGLSAANVHFFWIFATVELLLQSSRFFMEKGQVQQGGLMGTIAGLLPEPWKSYVKLSARYSRIWMTISGDAMVCLFVLGACAWWRST